MSNNDSPAGSPGGPVTVPALPELPERMRVHALARMLALPSRDVLAALADLGVEARSPQSSIERGVAEQVVAALVPSPGERGPDDPEDLETPLASAAADAEPVDEQGTPLAPLFAPPTPLFQAPVRPEPADAEPAVDEGEPAEAGEEAGEAEEPAGRRRRRRGRRGRGRGRGGEGAENAEEEPSTNGDDTEDMEDTAEAEDAAGEEDAETDAEEAGEAEAEVTGTRRRRRRRRRRVSGEDSAEADEDADAPNVVTKVRPAREPREDDGDGVQSVRGSTRLEAKRQRRRDGRDAGRRRAPILTEAEFLARRESVERSMVVRERGDRVEIAVLEDDVLVEHFVAGGRDGSGKSLVGNIYLGRVQNVLPSMEAAFVDIGRGRNAVLYAGEVDWDAAGLGGKSRRIEQALSSGDSVLVQVTKDPIGHKGARLTTQISLAGRFLVYVPGGGAAGISRKLPDIERKRLKDMLKEIVPSDAGVIIRTASEGVSHEALERDVRRLQAQWEVIKNKAESSGPNAPKAPALLYEEPDLLIKVVRDQFNEDFSRLVVQGDDAWDTLQNYVGHVAPELADRLHRHVGPGDVFSEYRIDEQLLKALDRKVWLPSGGTLVIDRTEAMTVIDVNTGKFTGSGGNLEETVTRNNLEAAEEIVRQLRLRDIGGIIVIDFIDMVLEANRDLVLRRLTECLARDRTRHQVAEVTSLGLVQMTRKRVGSGLLEHFSTPCEHCRGRGVIVNADAAIGNGNGGGSRPERYERDREGRRSRGRGRRDGEDRNGHDVRAEVRPEPEKVVPEKVEPEKAEPEKAVPEKAVPENVEAPTPAAVGGAVRNGSHADAPAAADTSVDVGAPAPEIEPPAPTDIPPATPQPTPDAAPAPAASTGRVRRRARRGVVEAGPAQGPIDVAADAVEEVVVERDLAEQTRPASVEPGPAPAAEPTRTPEPAPASAQIGSAEPDPARPRRHTRVRRSAGAPTATAGPEPVVAVVTVPGPGAAVSPPATPVPVPPQPEPTVVSRPRRSRRAASRPAGPPAPDTAEDPA